MTLTTQRRATLGIVFVLCAFLAPKWLSEFWLGLLSVAMIWAIAASGVNLLGGFGGLLSLGHAGILGVAAYGVALASTRLGVGVPGQLMTGMVVGLLATAIFAAVAIRTSGVYFLLVTLALGMTVWGGALRLNSLTGGDNGIRGIVRPGAVDAVEHFYWLCVLVSIASLGLIAVVSRSRFGLALRGLSDSERRVEAIGYNPATIRFLAFLLSGVFASVAGILFAYFHRFTSPEAMTFAMSGKFLLMVILGGAGTLMGPAAGSLIVTVIENYLSLYVARWPTVLGLVFIAGVLLAPQGVVRLRFERAHGWTRKWRITGSNLARRQ